MLTAHAISMIPEAGPSHSPKNQNYNTNYAENNFFSHANSPLKFKFISKIFDAFDYLSRFLIKKGYRCNEKNNFRK
jgi:hypothetical protein